MPLLPSINKLLLKRAIAISILSLITILLLSAPLAAQQNAVTIQSKKKVWVFIMAGQSNMAGRAAVEPQDTVTNSRIFTINAKNEIILAKEPLHFYEPAMSGLDCGLSFAKTLLPNIPDSISILIIPTAVGGSSISQWLGDSLHRGVRLLSNFKEKIDFAKRQGTLKAILWHQGESDAKEVLAETYLAKLKNLFRRFRSDAQNKALPILTAPIGLFASDTSFQHIVNTAIVRNALRDDHIFCIANSNFHDKGDKLHLDGPSQRLMGERMAVLYLQQTKRNRR